jgi:hypothetical protein
MVRPIDYDERCGDLARVFLADAVPDATEAQVDFVAGRIQLAAEGAIAEIQEIRRPRGARP